MSLFNLKRKVGDRGRVLIPKTIQDGLNIKEGDAVILSVKEGGIIEIKKESENEELLVTP